MKKYKLTKTLYYNEDNDAITDTCDGDCKLWARIGTVFHKMDERQEREKHTDIKEALDAKNFFISISGRFLYGDDDIFDFFDEVK